HGYRGRRRGTRGIPRGGDPEFEGRSGRPLRAPPGLGEAVRGGNSGARHRFLSLSQEGSPPSASLPPGPSFLSLRTGSGGAPRGAVGRLQWKGFESVLAGASRARRGRGPERPGGGNPLPSRRLGVAGRERSRGPVSIPDRSRWCERDGPSTGGAPP